jgi:lysophospholipase L1-like esterase
MMPTFALLLLLLALPSARAEPPSTDTDEQCQAPSEYVRFNTDLAHAKASIREQSHLDIVALGSSTTQGAGSSRPGSDYPSRLQTELSERLPGVTVTVWNQGLGGQTARDMLERIYKDVVDLGPQLVIWQTGVNDAIEDIPVEQFADTLRQGIDVLRAHEIDIILMDLQYYPASARVPDYGEYLAAMREVAREKQVPIFHRFDLMKYWLTSGEFELDELLSRDGLHMVDRSYYCLALKLSDAIVGELR